MTSGKVGGVKTDSAVNALLSSPGHPGKMPSLSEPVSLSKAIALHKAGKLDEAASIYQSILAIEENNAECLHLLGMIARARGDRSLASDLVYRALQVSDREPRFHNSYGALHAECGDVKLAELHYKKAITLAPKYMDARYNLALLYEKNGLIEDAFSVYEECTRIAPRHARGFYALGLLYQKHRSDINSALQMYRHALEIDPQFGPAYNNIGILLQSRGDYEKAVSQYLSALRLNPEFAEAHLNLGNVYLRLGRYKDAGASYGRAIECKPGLAAAYIGLGSALNSLGDLGQAIQAFEKAVAIDPGAPEGYFNLGGVLKLLNQYHRAEACYRRVIALSPKFLEAYNDLGIVLHLTGRCEEAIEVFGAALSLDPNCDKVYNNLACVYESIGHFEKAIEYFRLAIRQNKKQPEYYCNLSNLVKFSSGSHDLHSLELLEADEQSFSDAARSDLYFALGKAYGDMQDHERSFEYISRANSLRRRTVSYDEEAVMKYFDSIEAVFTRELVESKRRLSGHDSESPVFIVGMPRSGTSLLEQILASHTDVVGLGELKTMAKIAGSIKLANEAPVPYPEFVRYLEKDDLIRIGSQYITDIIGMADKAGRVRRFTDKMPMNFLLLGLISLVFPKATILHATRDPVDTCVSCFSRRFTDTVAFTYDLGELGRYYKRYAQLMRHWRNVFPDARVIEVKYETLIAEPEAQIRRLIEVCGLQWDQRCLSFYEASHPVRTASAAQVRRPLYNTSVGRWRVHEHQLKPLLAELGDLVHRSERM